MRELMYRAGHSTSQAALIYIHAVEECNRAVAEGLNELVKETRQQEAMRRRDERSDRDAG